MSQSSCMIPSEQEMAYIDYDTRDMTFDMDVPKAYQVHYLCQNNVRNGNI